MANLCTLSLAITQGTKHSTFQFSNTLSKTINPVKLTHSGSVSALQPLSNGLLLLTKSSYTSPNDLFLLGGLDALEANADSINLLEEEQMTHFTESALKEKNLSPAEEFWFKGADDVDVQGWIVKPPGWNKKQRKEWPIALHIHGGEFCASLFTSSLLRLTGPKVRIPRSSAMNQFSTFGSMRG